MTVPGLLLVAGCVSPEPSPPKVPLQPVPLTVVVWDGLRDLRSIDSATVTVTWLPGGGDSWGTEDIRERRKEIGLTDATGRFVRLLQDAPDATVMISKEGFGTVVREVKQPSMELQVSLYPEASATGRVVDDTNRPVEGALVEAWRMPLRWNTHRSITKTQADGTFSLHGLAKSERYLVMVNAPSSDFESTHAELFAPFEHRELVLPFGSTVFVSLAHPRRETRVGSTDFLLERWDDGTWIPASDAKLELDAAHQVVRFSSVVHGTYRVVARSPEIGCGATDVIWIQGRKMVDENVILGSGREVSGTVLDAHGEPIEGALVNLGTEPREKTAVHTDVNGSFSVELPAVDACIVVARRGFEPLVVPVLAAENALGTVTLSRSD